ncbi:amidophosphoribosyltransferase [Candidatus Peregrinibacteria bacterium CG_4_10_14_0_2_um_filter_38_24]|nr:MAG: amidophosphoribosyltransferase [Candidatus Peregrinibacteria bacterium CG_4_10_14_0_2_um_filter_38_24]PJC39349.1 MAG: amidophosphoribosyltransferase [Candidatus Peregrinibacteria bacterium CG_4_9_14_0_2_um_filter_38_9]
MCGVLGVFGHDHVAQDVYDGLVTLQHRGQDATGMITYDGKFHVRKNTGLVKDVFHTRHMKRLTGYVGIGHTRYSTIGAGGTDDAQPFLGASPYGVMLAHNGNVFNAFELKKELFEKDHRHVNSDCDAEVILNLFTKSLSTQNPADGIKPEHIWKAVESVYKRAKGSYSVVSYIAKQGMVGFRDPHGIRPLLFGKRDNGMTVDYIFASESVTLDILGFEIVKDVEAGEAIFIDEKNRKVHSKKIANKEFTPCIFEYVYFARPDSILNNISVHQARHNMGIKMAKRIKAAKLDIDIVVPVPDSSRTAAFSVSEELGLKYCEGLVKNRYIGRTFIMPGQKIRKKSIKYKLNAMPLLLKGKKVMLVDDSIVRGNTSKQIIQMVREAGAKKVYFASYYPPVINPCLYGVDMPSRKELIASTHSIEEICKFLGADHLIYNDADDVLSSCVKENPKVKNMCMGCINGKYPTGDVSEEVLQNQAHSRSCERDRTGDDVFLKEEMENQLNLTI